MTIELKLKMDTLNERMKRKRDIEQQTTSAKAKMDELQKKVEELGKSGADATKIKEQLDKVTQEYNTYKQDNEKREVNRKKTAAIEA
jgi:hypothetical protein